MSTVAAVRLAWKNMHIRCSNKNSASYHRYGGRGIKVCKRWENFENFYKDMGLRPKGLSLDRIDNDGDYKPSNCRWATMRVQQNNKANLVKVTKDGVTKTIGQWMHELGFNYRRKNTVYKRHSFYGAKTYEDLFCSERLFNVRLKRRINKCKECAATKSCKWRKNGKQCNTCYQRQFRKGKRNERRRNNS